MDGWEGGWEENVTEKAKTYCQLYSDLGGTIRLLAARYEPVPNTYRLYKADRLLLVKCNEIKMV